ncbi:hypothetical protein ACS0TY_010010 [Phlomoides rotata]
MKRFRDDDDALADSEPRRRPAISPRVEQPEQRVQIASSAPKLTTNDALSYLKHVKEIFDAENDNKYDVFLKVMKDFKAQRVTTSGVISRVKELFGDNRDLVLGFNTFLPKGHEITLPPEDEPLPEKNSLTFEDALGFVSKIKARFDGNVYKAFLDILYMYRKNNKTIQEIYQEVAGLFQEHVELLVDFIHFLPGICGTISADYKQSLMNHIINGDGRDSPMTMAWCTQVEKWNHVDKDEVKREDAGKDDCEKDIGHRSARGDDSVTDQFRQELKDMELSFCAKVRDRLQNPEVAEKCSDCIRAFLYMFCTEDDFCNLIYSLLGAHSDVMEACEDFFSYIDKNGSLRNNRRVFRTLKVDGRDYHDRKDAEKNKDHNIRARDRHDRGLSSNTKDFPGQSTSCASKEKFLAKPIQELDLSNCESCTPSYRHLPENYPIPSTSRRTEIGDEVLNDRWVSVTSGSEDYSFKHMRKNQYEESLFRCEDDRFELDMLLESVKATAKRVEELIDSMNARAFKTESSFHIEDHLTVLNLRCIERLYGDHGLDVTDALRKNAPLALPVILTRLKQKQGEWERCRVDFNKVWAEIYAKNYHKSLDHRSFYFKQQDTKDLTAKALLTKIRDLSEKDQTEDELVLSIYALHLLPDKVHIEVEYPDPDVHEDIFQLLKFSCAEICTPEQSDQVLKTWSTFIEPMLGIPSRSPSAEDNGYAVTNKGIKKILNNVGNENSICSDEAAGGKSINDGNASATLKGNDQASSGCGTKLMPSQESQDGNIANLASLSFGAVPEEVKAQKSNEETEGGGKAEREEGELSPPRNLEENNFSASANAEEMRIDKAGVETDANADDEGGQGSLESENASGNGNVSETESANGEDEGAHDADSLLLTVKPLNVKVPMALQDEERNSQVFYGNDSFYLLFVLHKMLYERLQKAKLDSSPAKRGTILNDANPTDSYARFKDLLYSWLNGSIDNQKYQDDCRAIIGSQSFVLLTLNKLIHKLVKQTQTIVTQKVDTELLQLSDYERSRSSKTFTDAIYRANARFLLQRDNMYRIEFFSSPTRMTIQLMKNDEHDVHDQYDPMSISMDPYFAAYLNDELLFVRPERKKQPGVFLKRNKRKRYSSRDEGADFCKAMEGVVMHNGVTMRFTRGTNQIGYVLGTEDFFYRPKKMRRIRKGKKNEVQLDPEVD